MTLETFVGQHRQSHVVMTQCQRHIHVELPTDYSRVTALLDSIKCDNARLQAALSQVRTDESDTGPRHSFEKAEAIILPPQDPVARKRTTGKRPSASISSIEAEGNGNLKFGKGKTEVELRWHKIPEYAKLSKESKDELLAERDARHARGLSRNLPGGPPTPDKKGSKQLKTGKAKKKDSNTDMHAMIAAAVAASTKASAATASEGDNELKTQIKALVSSIDSDNIDNINCELIDVIASLLPIANPLDVSVRPSSGSQQIVSVGDGIIIRTQHRRFDIMTDMIVGLPSLQEVSFIGVDLVA
jgi:hypothetical protein